jgi:hypothetical protein
MKKAPKTQGVLVLPILLAFVLLLSSCNLPFLSPEATEAVVDTTGGNGGIAGRIWHDLCASPPEGMQVEAAPPGCVRAPDGISWIANGKLDADEIGLHGIEVRLGLGPCPAPGEITTVTAADGLYLFTGLAAGEYCVSIDPESDANANILPPGIWTYPASTSQLGVIGQLVILDVDDVRSDVYFAWDYLLLPPYSPVGTDTPVVVETAAPTETPEPSETPDATATPTPTPTPTLGSSDPRAALGDPTWQDDFADASDWAIYEDDHVRFEVADDTLTMTAFNADFYNGWLLSWQKDDNFYIEATGTTGTCAGRDAYGLMFRASASDKGYIGYLFGISCDGRYSLRSWDGEVMSKIIDWTPSSALASGADQTHRLGVWAQGDELSLYAQGELLTTVTESTHATGLFGVFISAAQTPNFKSHVEEYLYWDLE